MLFGQGRFKLGADGFNAFNLVKVIEISTIATGKVGKLKLSVCESGSLLTFLASGFVIVAANND